MPTKQYTCDSKKLASYKQTPEQCWMSAAWALSLSPL